MFYTFVSLAQGSRDPEFMLVQRTILIIYASARHCNFSINDTFEQEARNSQVILQGCA